MTTCSCSCAKADPARIVVPNYDLSASFSKRLQNASYVQIEVKPNWLPDKKDSNGSNDDDDDSYSSFWYRRKLGDDRFEFVFVDAAQGIRRPAFDHERLAAALERVGVKASSDKFPFTSINLCDDDDGGQRVRFRAGGKNWQFRNADRDGEGDGDGDGGGILEEYDGDIQEDFIKPMAKEKPSGHETEETAVTFVNQTNHSIRIFWIDWDGKPLLYSTVEAGGQSRQETYVSHVWRVTHAETKAKIANFVAQKTDSTAVIDNDLVSLAQKHEGDETSTEVKADSEPPEQPTGKVWVKEFNVWTRDVDGNEIQLSTTGTKDNPFDHAHIYTSPNEHFAVVYQYTPEQEHKVYTVESSPEDQLQPCLKDYQYLKPGDKVRIDRPRLFDLQDKKEIPTEDSLFQNPFGIIDFGWSVDGSEYRFVYNRRGHQVCRVVGMSVKGDVRTVFEETSETFIEYHQKLQFEILEKSDELITMSERDGWNHLYLVDLKKGEVKNQITRGEWVVRSIDRVDEEKQQIWLMAMGLVEGRDPYYSQLVRVNFDGSALTVLTEENGTHTCDLSPDKKYLIDTWSRVDQPPKCVLREAETGKEIVVLEGNNLEKLVDAGWTIPEQFVSPGRDGKTLIYGIIIRPSNFDKDRKYPVIEQIYAGPQDFFVPKAFSQQVAQHELAELGFIVVQIDGMGTNWRSKAFHNQCYKNLKDAGLPDRIAWMKEAAKSRPWMDLDRGVGIYGTSAGGQSAMGAVLWHGDFYKAAVADSGCHDNRMDKLWWNEQWMGWPVDKSYSNSSNVVHAGRLQGALMLIVGELDTNVDPATTMQVVNALNEARKDYELLFVPGGEHGVGSRGSAYVKRRQRDFFVRHIMGVEPPDRNAE